MGPHTSFLATQATPLMPSPDRQSEYVVLIVDDVPTNLGVLFEYLDSCGFRVLVAEDGHSALEQAQYARPDIILLDMMMPGIDGIKTCRQLKEDARTAEIPVIFMTALTDIDHKVQGFQAGAVDYVTKPFQKEELLLRLTTHLALRALERELRIQNLELENEILQRERAQAELQNYVRDLETSNAELDAFARTVAHDLKDPLSQILGCAQLIELDGGLTGEVAEYLGNIRRVGQHMGRVVDELLLLARVRHEEVERSLVFMTELIDNAQERLALMLDDAGVELVGPRTWPAALGYGPWIEEVWVNYLSNAIKYGGGNARIELGAKVQQDGFVRYWVRDFGPGIAEEMRPLLFQEFAQLASRRKSIGHGLGLSIVKRIIDKLGGRVGVESTLGQGSTFYFELPVAST